MGGICPGLDQWDSSSYPSITTTPSSPAGHLLHRYFPLLSTSLINFGVRWPHLLLGAHLGLLWTSDLASHWLPSRLTSQFNFGSSCNFTERCGRWSSSSPDGRSFLCWVQCPCWISSYFKIFPCQLWRWYLLIVAWGIFQSLSHHSSNSLLWSQFQNLNDKIWGNSSIKINSELLLLCLPFLPSSLQENYQIYLMFPFIAFHHFFSKTIEIIQKFCIILVFCK